MKDNIYASVALFPTCKETLDKYKEQEQGISATYCTQVTGISTNIKTKFNQNCPKADFYLNEIYKSSHSNDELKRAACIYIYYWIYNDILKDTGNDIEIQNLYNGFLEAHHKPGDLNFKDFVDIKITKNELKKLKDIYEIDTEIKNMDKDKCACAKKLYNFYIQQEDECKHKSNNDFCDELENIRDRYNAQMINTNCPDGTPQLLPSFHPLNITKLIITTIVIIIVISIFIIILYKNYQVIFRGIGNIIYY
ncbi:variable surface protein, partial [Plasmodium gonderi]